jgi:hypothetical protein
MLSKRENGLVIKVSADRVNQLITENIGKPFDFTGKRFKEWVLILTVFAAAYDAYLAEALAHAKRSSSS